MNTKNTVTIVASLKMFYIYVHSVLRFFMWPLDLTFVKCAIQPQSQILIARNLVAVI